MPCLAFYSQHELWQATMQAHGMAAGSTLDKKYNYKALKKGTLKIASIKQIGKKITKTDAQPRFFARKAKQVPVF